MLIKIQSRTYLWTASLLVSAAINDLLKLLLTILSIVGIWGMGVRGVLTPDYNAGEIGVVGVGRGFAVRVENGRSAG